MVFVYGSPPRLRRHHDSPQGPALPVAACRHRPALCDEVTLILSTSLNLMVSAPNGCLPTAITNRLGKG